LFTGLICFITVILSTITSITSKLDLYQLEFTNFEGLGNKYFKLKYNLEAAKKARLFRLLTFGGAYSNHIAAVAKIGKQYGFETIGVIRGEELATKESLNPTLLAAKANGMQFHFVDRETYRNKESLEFIAHLKSHFGDFYMIPEGGTNPLAVQGCAEILGANTNDYDVITLPVGTGGTIAGIVTSSLKHQSILGFSVLKGTFQKNLINNYTSKSNFDITDEYCFGGYGKIDIELIRFMNRFKSESGILLDPIYTGKMLFGITKMIKEGIFSANTRILAIHTGGTQGIPGMNELLKRKNLPQIEM